MTHLREVGAAAYSKGLEPDDFIRASTSLNQEDYDSLKGLGIQMELNNLGKNHPVNSLSPWELDCICYKRMGAVPSYIGYEQQIARNLDIPLEFIPDGLVMGQLVLSYEGSLGKRSYKNFIRRLTRIKKDSLVEKSRKLGVWKTLLRDIKYRDSDLKEIEENRIVQEKKKARRVKRLMKIEQNKIISFD